MPSLQSRIVEIFVFTLRENEPSFLLLKRSDRETIYPGIWQIVTGTLEEDETAAAAALRELHEETGLTPLRWWAVPYVQTFLEPKTDIIHLAPVFAAQVSLDAPVTLSHEHSEYQWCNLSRAKELLVWPGQRYAIEIIHEYIIGEKDVAHLTEIRNP